jgi:hypothetical protein
MIHSALSDVLLLTGSRAVLPSHGGTPGSEHYATAIIEFYVKYTKYLIVGDADGVDTIGMRAAEKYCKPFECWQALSGKLIVHTPLLNPDRSLSYYQKTESEWMSKSVLDSKPLKLRYLTRNEHMAKSLVNYDLNAQRVLVLGVKAPWSTSQGTDNTLRHVEELWLDIPIHKIICTRMTYHKF